MIAVEQHAEMLGERGAIGAQNAVREFDPFVGVAKTAKERRSIGETRRAQLRGFEHRNARRRRLLHLHVAGDPCIDLDPIVPNFEWIELRVGEHRLAIRMRCRNDGIFGAVAANADRCGEDDEARREAQHIPFPRAG